MLDRRVDVEEALFQTSTTQWYRVNFRFKITEQYLKTIFKTKFWILLKSYVRIIPIIQIFWCFDFYKHCCCQFSWIFKFRDYHNISVFTNIGTILICDACRISYTKQGSLQIYEGFSCSGAYLHFVYLCIDRAHNHRTAVLRPFFAKFSR